VPPVLALFALAWLLAGCAQREPTRWDQAERESQASRQAVAKESVAGSSFNRFFPRVSSPFDIIYKQEKKGFAAASLKQSGKEVALLSISDTLNNPSAADKYRGGATLAGHPTAAIGSQGTGLLVADRFQVQVRSASPAFSAADRETWLQKFDLDGLARLR
jgi:hypothetical protein